MKDKRKSEVSEPRFTREALARSARYASMRDLLTALLDENERYTFDEADTAINNFMKGRIK